MPHSEYESSVRGCESVFWSWKTVLVWLRGIQALSVNLFFVLRYVAEAVMILPYSGTSEPIRVYFDGINNRSRTGSKRVHINLIHTHTHTHTYSLSLLIYLSLSLSVSLSLPLYLFILFSLSLTHPLTHLFIQGLSYDHAFTLSILLTTLHSLLHHLLEYYDGQDVTIFRPDLYSFGTQFIVGVHILYIKEYTHYI